MCDLSQSPWGCIQLQLVRSGLCPFTQSQNMALNSKGSVLLGSNGNATVERLKVQTSASGSSQFATTRKHLPQNFSPGRPASPAAPPPVGGRRCSWRRGSAKLDSAACAGAKVPFGYRCFVVLKENPKGMPRFLGSPPKRCTMLVLFKLDWTSFKLPRTLPPPFSRTSADSACFSSFHSASLRGLHCTSFAFLSISAQRNAKALLGSRPRSN